jgi:twitching motility two-component system response regulator PilG
MPRLDGYQVCKIVKGAAETKHVPVVFISGKDGFFDKARGRMAGSDAYVTKPFGPDALSRVLQTFVPA